MGGRGWGGGKTEQGWVGLESREKLAEDEVVGERGGGHKRLVWLNRKF